MQDEDKTKEQLIAELNELRQMIAESEKEVRKREETHKPLRDSEAKYRRIVDTANEGIWSLDENFVTTYVNARMVEMLGYDESEMIGRPVHWFMFEEDLPDLREKMRDRRTGISDCYERRYRHEDGRTVWVMLSVTPLIDDEDGSFKGSFSMITDITERKRMEEKLRLSEEKYRALVETTSDCIWETDSQARFTYLSPKFEDLTGYPPEEFLGRTPDDLLLGDEAHKVREQVSSTIAAQRPISSVEAQFRHRDGRLIMVEVSSIPIFSPEGEYRGRGGITRDITRRKRAEEALRKSEECYKALFERSLDCVFLTDFEGRFLDANHAALDLLGYQREDINRLTFASLLSADQHHLAFQTAEEIRASGFQKNPTEYRLRRKDGEYVFVETQASLIFRDGKPFAIQGIARDITERKRAEEALISANQRLTDIIEFLPDATFVIDNDKKVIAWNRAIEEMTGVSKKDMLGKGDHTYTIPFYGERRRQLLDLLDEDDEKLASRYQNLRKVGNVLYSETFAPCLYGGKGAHVFATGAPLLDLHGNRSGAIESIRDITKRKEAEEALKESRRQLADIINFLPDATLVIDKEGKVIAWNRAMEAMTETDAADMLGKGNYEYALPFYGERRPILIDLVLKPQKGMEAKYIKVESKDAVLAGEAYMPALRGGEVYLYGKASVLRDSKGNIVGAIESIRDITERRRVEESLARAEEKYRSIFENALEGIYQVTAEGCFLSCNPALARILGYDSPEELMNTVTDIAQQLYVNPGRRLELLRLIEERGEAKEFKAQFFRKDKSVAWVAINVRAIHDESGKLAQLEGILQDITERKTMESRLLQSQKMEAVGKLAGGIAHDFNNILAAIIGYTEIAKVKLQQRELHSYLDQVLRAGDRAKDLVEQILAFSRKADKEIKPVDIGSLIVEALKLLRATIPSTIQIRQEISPGVGEVLADPIQLHQVMMNLCTNAAHAMREKGGILEVCLSRVEIMPEMVPLYPDLKPGPHVKLRVNDTGTGMAPDLVHKIFDPFFTTKKVGEGSGLGLSVVYGIVNECGGTVAVQSEVGRGSTFSIYLPAIEHGAGAPEELIGAIPGGRERILFIDDEEILVEMGREMLEGLGYEVMAVARSVTALDIFRAEPDRFDLVITDMTMPGMTGKELATELLGIRPDLPIILCTGFSEIVTEEEARLMGIREFAIKPLNLRSIAELIRKALDSKES